MAPFDISHTSFFNVGGPN